MIGAYTFPDDLLPPGDYGLQKTQNPVPVGAGQIVN